MMERLYDVLIDVGLNHTAAQMLDDDRRRLRSVEIAAMALVYQLTIKKPLPKLSTETKETVAILRKTLKASCSA